MSTQCYKCGSQLPKSFSVFIARSDACTQCRTDMRSCRMCQFHDVKSYNECRESSAERVVDKEKANFCDYFKLRSSYNDPNKEREELLARAQALFKK